MSDAAWQIIDELRETWCYAPCNYREGCGCADAIAQRLDPKDARISELEAALHRINALNDSPARFNSDIQEVLNAVIDTSDTVFARTTLSTKEDGT